MCYIDVIIIIIKYIHALLISKLIAHVNINYKHLEIFQCKSILISDQLCVCVSE